MCKTGKNGIRNATKFSTFAVFNKQIQRFIEHGFVDYWYKGALTEFNISFMSNFYAAYVENYYSKPLNIEKLQGAFYLLTLG